MRAEFSRALAAWKQDLGWSDRRICAATGLDRTTVSALRLGRQRPQPRTIAAFMELPNFPLYLLGTQEWIDPVEP